MQNTSCTEDRIQHAFNRCLDGLRTSPTAAPAWNVLMCSAGQSMNRWSLEELVKREPDNFLILLQQIIRRTKEVLEQCQYELVAPLAIMFSSTLLQTPYCPPDTELLEEAVEVFRSFLTWPEPYCSACKSLLFTLQQEIRAPGISFHRLVREEQGLTTPSHRSKTITVLLMNPGEVPADFLSVAEQLSGIQHSRRDVCITLVKHAYQAAMGTKYPLSSIHQALQAKSVEELEEIFAMVTDILETAAANPQKSRGHVTQELEGLRERIGIPASNGRKSDGMLQTLPVPTAKSYMLHWDTDNFDILNTILEKEHDPAGLQPSEDEEEDEEEGDLDEDEEVGAEVYREEGEDEEGAPPELEEYNSMSFVPNGYNSDHRASTVSTVSSLSTASKDSMYSTLSVASRSSAPSHLSTASGVDSDFFEEPEDSSPLPAHGKNSKSSKGRLSMQFYRLFGNKPPKNAHLVRARSLGSPESRDLLAVRSKQRSNSLPQQVHLRSPEPGHQTLRHVCFRRRPILSSDEDGKQVTLRVAVFGADHMAGKVARAYSSLRRRENECPRLSRDFRLQFYFVPVKRDGSLGGAVVPGAGGLNSPCPRVASGSPLKGAVQDLSLLSTEDSTNDIARFVGMLDPWYERNTLSLLNLPASVVCQQTSKTESESYDNSYEQPLPILVDLVLYYCRHAERPALIQLYQAELTLAGGERKTEVLIHSLELGHTAGTRAIKAMGAARKRFGIDGDREAVPLKLEVLYNRVVISGRSLWKRADKQYTSITLTKACKNPEELDSKMECLQLTMTEVLKRQNSKSKKGYNQQLSVTEVKVDKVQVTGGDNITFAVCLDQDEKKIFQSVTKCEVSVCYKPDSSSDWRLGKTLPGQIQPLNPTFCSLLCLPIATFSGAQP